MSTPVNRPDITRERAFDLVGMNHYIPAFRGVDWIHADLMRALEDLELGASIVLDYRGSVPDAPNFALERSAADVVTLGPVEGILDGASESRLTWPPSDLPSRNAEIAHDILKVILKRRGPTRVVLIPPSRSITPGTIG